MIVVYTLALLLLLYTSVLLINAYGYIRTKSFLSASTQSDTPLSIIVCARNEEKHLGLCLKSILAQHYNKNLLQIIVVNDASEDATLRIAKSILEPSGIDFFILNNETHLGKKASISKAILSAKHNTIITRDADTFTLSHQWLNTLIQFKIQENYALVIAPVNMANSSGLLWALQCVENRVLTVISAGTAYFKKPFLCSGANLLFTKTVFEKTKGYQSHINIASGDDVLFLEDIKKIEGSKIAFLKSEQAMVYTYPQFKVSALLAQKVRWAQKFSFNPNRFNLVLGALVFFVNAAWIVSFVAFFLHLPFHNYFMVFTILKLLPELFLLFLSRRFMVNKHLFWYALAVALVYPFYALGVAFLSLFFKPKWK